MQQVITTTRFSAKRLGIALMTIGTLATSLVGAITLTEVTSSDSSHTAATSARAHVTSAPNYRFLELNTELPTGTAPVLSAAEIIFLEQNTQLPDGNATLSMLSPDQRGVGPTAF